MSVWCSYSYPRNGNEPVFFILDREAGELWGEHVRQTPNGNARQWSEPELDKVMKALQFIPVVNYCSRLLPQCECGQIIWAVDYLCVECRKASGL